MAVELYDHTTDPRETRDIAAQPEHQRLLGQLIARLQAQWPAAQRIPK